MTRKIVLLVDDDPVFVDAVSAVLEGRFEVRTAANGTIALAAVAAAPPDVIVLDVMMDHLSEGFDVARTLKGAEATRRIPIVMLTGADEVYDMRMEIGDSWRPYDRYLEKPVSPARLVATLDELLQ